MTAAGVGVVVLEVQGGVVVGHGPDARRGIAGDVLTDDRIVPLEVGDDVAPPLTEGTALVAAVVAEGAAADEPARHAVAVLVGDDVSVDVAVTVGHRGIPRHQCGSPHVHLHAGTGAVGGGAEVRVVEAANGQVVTRVLGAHVVDAAEVPTVLRFGEDRVASAAAAAEVVDLEVGARLVEAMRVEPVVHDVGVVEQLRDRSVSVGVESGQRVEVRGGPPRIGERVVEVLVARVAGPGRRGLVLVVGVVVVAVEVGVDVVAARRRATHPRPVQPGEGRDLPGRAGGLRVLFAGHGALWAGVRVAAQPVEDRAGLGVDDGLPPGLAGGLDVGEPGELDPSPLVGRVPDELGQHRTVGGVAHSVDIRELPPGRGADLGFLERSTGGGPLSGGCRIEGCPCRQPGNRAGPSGGPGDQVSSCRHDAAVSRDHDRQVGVADSQAVDSLTQVDRGAAVRERELLCHIEALGVAGTHAEARGVRCRIGEGEVCRSAGCWSGQR